MSWIVHNLKRWVMLMCVLCFEDVSVIMVIIPVSWPEYLNPFSGKSVGSNPIAWQVSYPADLSKLCMSRPALGAKTNLR